LGAWFDIFPLSLKDIGGVLEAVSRPFLHDQEEVFTVCVPPFEVHRTSTQVAAGTKAEEAAVTSYNSSRKESCNKLTLCSSTGSDRFGGVCDASNSMADVFERYFGETLWEEIAGENGWSSKRRWLEMSLGSVSRHRNMARTHQHGPCISRQAGLDAMFDIEDATLAGTNLLLSGQYLRESLGSMNGFMQHLENLGHSGVEEVEGLKVDLLPFQTQTVQWALEREQVPGGIQSFFWVQVPVSGLYYSPVLQCFRKDKPRLVRGGFIAEEMGLGKTISSLALILQNAAPSLPPSGSDVALLSNDHPQEVLNSHLGWDKNLYKETSTSNKKRGSILSRGTLVICPVSLVGQWIEEAKSKLENPGLVYPYHGNNRTRNALILAKNAIVVTTYQILASDFTYHAKKQGEGYCAPLEQVRWWRIIYDEGHSLRQAQTNNYKAVANLVADHRWLVSGTPLSTSMMDLKGQLKILGIECVEDIFRQLPGLKGGGRRSGYHCAGAGMQKLMFLMRSIMMRHTQKQKYRGTSTTLMSLPAKVRNGACMDYFGIHSVDSLNRSLGLAPNRQRERLTFRFLQQNFWSTRRSSVRLWTFI
jgi:hypothetical protein